MQVDSNLPQPGPAPAVSSADHRAEYRQLRRALRSVRRRWPIVLVLTALGGALGLITAPDAAPVEEVRDYYMAENALTLESARSSNPDDPMLVSDVALELQRAAFLATEGDVPERVAEDLGLELEYVGARVGAKPLPGVGSVKVFAISEDAEEAAELADTTAAHLTRHLAEVATEQMVAEQERALERKAEIEAERDSLLAQLEGAPPEQIDSIQAQLAAVMDDLTLALTEIRRISAASGNVGSSLVSIEAAKPVRIDEPTFVSLEEEIALGTEQYLSSRPEEEEDEPQVSSPAAPASTPVRVAAGGVLGLIAGLVATALWARYDTHVHYSDEVETITGFPVLAEIPPLSKAQQKSHDILASDAPRSATTEAYRVVRTAILFADSARQLRASRLGNEDEQGMVVMVTSAGPGEGKTTTTANLATVFAEGGMSVAVIDCDFRRPTIHKYLLGEEDELIKERHGGDSLPEEALATLDNSWVDGVRLIHKVGTSQNSPIEIVHRQQQVIELARRHFDIVLLDTAPFMTTNDAADLMPLTDHIIFLVRSGLTRAQAIRRGADFLHRANAPVIGVVMTNSEEPEGYYYYYRRYYSNYYHDGKDASDAGSNGRLRSYTSRSRRSRLGQANQAEDLGGLQVDDPALS